MWLNDSFVPVQVKELGAVVYNCSCLASDMSKIFDVYWYLGAPNSTIPSTWPASLDTSINNKTTLQIKFNDSEASTYLSVHTTNTPMLFMLTILLLFCNCWICGSISIIAEFSSPAVPIRKNFRYRCHCKCYWRCWEICLRGCHGLLPNNSVPETWRG